MAITVQQGLVNTTSLSAPGLTIGIVAPQPSQLNGVPTNILGLVGTASYGPVNTPITVSGWSSFYAAFGPSIVRNGGIGGGDLGAAVAVALLHGCNNIVCVRVTDSVANDSSTSLAAASVELGIAGSAFAALITAKYGGSAGNAFTVTVSASQYPASVKVTLSSGLTTPEVFDGITNTTAAAFWAALVSAINNGSGALRPRSAYFLATAGTNTTATIPAAGTVFTLSGGADGVTSISTADYVGTDGTAGLRKGMYALRGTGCSVATLVDISDMTSWTTQLAFGLSESVYMVSASAVGDTIAAAVTRGTNGASGYGLKLMFGDWDFFIGPAGQQILISPATFAAARMASQLPNLSTLNQQIYGIVGSQFNQAGTVYAQADILALIQAGYDVITPPGQGASGEPIWSCATGNNTSYLPQVQGDNYTTMTNFIVKTIAAVGGLSQFLGQPITRQSLMSQKAVLDAYYQALQNNGLIGNSGGGLAFQNSITSSPTQQQNGVVVISSTVVYLAIERNLVVQLQAGQTIVITPQVGNNA